MKSRFNQLVVIAAALVALLGYSPAARAADPPISLDQAYQQIKDAERGMPIPGPEATVDVGTFNAATGEFDGLTTEIEIINHKPVRIVPNVFVNAVNTRLLFHILNATQLVRVTGAGATAIARAGETTVSLGVGRAHDVRWSISSGTKRYGDTLTIDRPTIIGAGAFTIPALPVAVIYDPPQNPARSNAVVYTRSTSVSTSIGLTVRQASSSTSAAVNPDFSEVGIFQQQLSAAANFATLTGNGAVATALTKIGGVLGKASRNVTTSTDLSSTGRRTFTLTDSRSCATDAGVAHLGPGLGDRIAYLRNVRVIWLDNGTSTYAQILGYGTFDCPTIDQLRSGVAGLTPAAAAPLIALDPFAGPFGPKAPLATDPRFAMLPGIGLLPDSVQTATFTQQLLLENSKVETSARVVTDDLGAGLLSLIGLAPSQSGSASSTLSVSNDTKTTDATTVTTALTARTLVPGVRTELSVFYDRTFGTVAFQDPRP